jgi:DNA polymerase-3 subunit delta'
VSAPVFSSLVGQEVAIAQLERALTSNETGNEMTHAWLFTGPPGSGRSVISLAFAAALVCKKKGCGDCNDCLTALSGTHQDVEIMKIDGLTIKVDEIREVVSRANWTTSISNWRVIVVEDSDRMTESAANALLKSLEEAGSSTVWLLSAPSSDDVLPTIRSRCRQVQLRIPTTTEIKDFLISTLNSTPQEAEQAARISQGHIGKARAFIIDKSLRDLRRIIFEILLNATTESKAISAASKIVDLAEERVAAKLTEELEKEIQEAKNIYQGTSRGFITGGSKALKELERDQKLKTTRAIKDEIDSYLIDYSSFIRDCLLMNGPWINTDLSEHIKVFQSKNREEDLSQLLSLVSNSRAKLATNASQSLVLETLFLSFVQSKSGN